MDENSEQELNFNFNFSKFITKEMFLTLAGCISIVTVSVEIFKEYTNTNPLILNLIMSSIVTLIRFFFVADFTIDGVILGIFNIIPILLGSTGMYEVVKHSVQAVYLASTGGVS